MTFLGYVLEEFIKDLVKVCHLMLVILLRALPTESWRHFSTKHCNTAQVLCLHGREKERKKEGSGCVCLCADSEENGEK